MPHDMPAAAGGHLVATRSWHTQLGRPAGRRQSVGRRDHIMQMHGRACSARAVYWCCPSITTRLGGPGALRRDVGSRAVPALVGSGGARRIIGDLIELLRRTGIGVLYRGVTAASNQQRQGRHAQDRSSDCRHDRPPFACARPHNAWNGARSAEGSQYLRRPESSGRPASRSRSA
jgi:hypothetical protein